MIAATKIFTDAVRAGDIAEGQGQLRAAAATTGRPSSQSPAWYPSVDGAVDSRVDDFATVQDPAFSGWHRIEYMLWVENKLTPLSKHYANLLDKDLKPLPGLLEKSKMTSKDVAQGAGGLIEEVSEGKITGEEDRYSHTDLYDLAANVNGSFRAFQTYEPMLVTVDKPLEPKIEQAFLDSKALLGKYQHQDGSYESFTALTEGRQARAAGNFGWAQRKPFEGIGDASAVTSSSPRGKFSRRALLGGAAVGTAGVGVGAVAGWAAAKDEGEASGSAAEPGFAPVRGWFGAHQPGIADRGRANTALASFTCVAADRKGLEEMFKALGAEAHRLCDGLSEGPLDPDSPPPTTGMMGDESTKGTAVTVSVGASLFDGRYGLADRKPAELVKMPFLVNDRLVPEWCHGDVLVQVAADRPDAIVHALRQLMRATRDSLVLHWTMSGFNHIETDRQGRPGEQPQHARVQGRHGQPRHGGA